MLQFDEYKVKLNNLRPELDELDQALGLDAARQEVEMLESESASDGFWDNLEKAQKVQQRVKNLRDKIEGQEKRKTQWEDLMTLCELGNEMEDESLVSEVEEGFAKLESAIEEAKMSTLFTGEYDNSNAILTFHAGAGGTEAQDWAQMLFRMYTRWAERHGFTCKTLDYLDGDEAGLKSATILIEGENAYGHLRSEHGVHRLVRVSPFDANARRQTSFAAVEVMPDLPEDADVEIRPEDYEMQVFRSSGARAQPVPEQGHLSADAAGQAGGAEDAAARREDLRYQGGPAQNRVGQPDPLLRLYALSAGEGQPHRLRDQQRQRRDGRRPGRVYQRLSEGGGHGKLGGEIKYGNQREPGQKSPAPFSAFTKCI